MGSSHDLPVTVSASTVPLHLGSALSGLCPSPDQSDQNLGDSCGFYKLRRSLHGALARSSSSHWLDLGSRPTSGTAQSTEGPPPCLAGGSALELWCLSCTRHQPAGRGTLTIAPAALRALVQWNTDSFETRTGTSFIHPPIHHPFYHSLFIDDANLLSIHYRLSTMMDMLL